MEKFLWVLIISLKIFFRACVWATCAIVLYLFLPRLFWGIAIGSVIGGMLIGMTEVEK